MAKFIEGKVIEQHRWTGQLVSLKVEAEPIAFEAGQFTKVALPVEGTMLARAYSFVNPPRSPHYEFYYVIVPDGPLTPRLGRLSPGDAVWLAPHAVGFLVLSEVPDAENLWLLATGTGIAPFLSILRSDTAWRRYRSVVLVEAVRHASELAYREELERVRREHEGSLDVVTFVSRDQAPARSPDAYRRRYWTAGSRRPRAWRCRPRNRRS